MRILSSSVTNHTFKWYDDYVIINNTHLIINNAHLINNIIVLHPVITVVILSHYICLYTPASLPVAAMVPDHLLRIPFVIQVAMVPLSEHAFTSLSHLCLSYKSQSDSGLTLGRHMDLTGSHE